MTFSEFEAVFNSKDYDNFKKRVSDLLDKNRTQSFKDREKTENPFQIFNSDNTEKETKVELTYGQRLKYVDDLIGRYLSANYETVFNDTEQGFLNYIFKNHNSGLNEVRCSNISDGSQATVLKRFTQRVVDETIKTNIQFSVNKTSQE